jgi:hypothetical protein
MKTNFKTEPDVLAFVNAAGITGGTEFMAIKYLVVALKNAGLWNNIKAIYPFVGGTASSHKYNLKDPRDVNAAYRLSFSGSVTHDSNGVTFSLANGFANTFLVPSTTFVQHSESMGLYSRTSGATATVNEVDMGCAVSTSIRDQLVLRGSGDGFGASINSTSLGSGTIGTTNTDAKGFYFISRNSSSNFEAQKNGVTFGSIATNALNVGSRSNIPMYLGCRNVLNAAQAFTGRNFALAIIGADYTSTQMTALYNIVQQYQTILNRQV